MSRDIRCIFVSNPLLKKSQGESVTFCNEKFVASCPVSKFVAYGEVLRKYSFILGLGSDHHIYLQGKFFL